MKKLIAVSLSAFLMLINFGSLAGSSMAYGQGTAEVRGLVTDETGAFIPAAPIVMDDGKGHHYAGQTDEQGRYRFTRVVPGLYTLTVEVEGFAPFSEQVDATKKQSITLDAQLKVFIEEQTDVTTDSPGISADPDNNLSAITLTPADIEALPDDPDELLDTLRQMAGAAGGGDDAAVYVGGFRERGRIPPKEAIQMIRINANPFAAEFSEVGFRRIEIITKPGTDDFHGSLRFNFNDESLNARDAFAPSKAALQKRTYSFDFSGPIIRKRMGFFMDFDRRAWDENDVVNATVLDPLTLEPTPFIASVPSPTRRTNFSLRTDYLLSSKHTIGAQYRFSTSDQENLPGAFDLPSRGLTRSSREDTVRFSLTTIASERAVNEARLQLSRGTIDTLALSDETAINVLDAFNSGGNQGSLFLNNRNNELEFTDNLTFTSKKHTIKAGIRAESLQRRNLDRSNFGGTFTFGTDFERDATGAVILDSRGNSIGISALEHYRRTLLGEPGYRPSQFSIVQGDPFVGFNQWETGLFAQDDWKISDRMTFSFGVRQEFQTHLGDKLNLAPRAGLAWVLDKKRKNTIRAGAGVFYNFIDDGITFDTIKYDGQHQLQYIIQQPAFFPDIPSAFSGAVALRPTIRTEAEDLKQPYSVISTVSYERQLPKNMFATAIYTRQRGVHLLRTRNINSPFLETDGERVFPFPGEGPIYQFESTGLSNRQELRVMLRANVRGKFSLFTNYSLSSTHSDTDSAYSVPANPYDLANEYGRSSLDARHQFFVGGSVNLPWSIRISSFSRFASGRPFNITTGRDNNGDTSFTDRPAFASPGDPDAIVTRFGVFNPNPGPGDQIIPRNYGNGPATVSVNMNFAKTFGFGTVPASGGQGGFGGGGRGGGGRGGFGGGRGGGGGFFGGDDRHKYNFSIGLNVNNILNHPNLGGYNGVLTSPFFGTANRASGARSIEAVMSFRF